MTATLPEQIQAPSRRKNLCSLRATTVAPTAPNTTWWWRQETGDRRHPSSRQMIRIELSYSYITVGCCSCTTTMILLLLLVLRVLVSTYNYSTTVCCTVVVTSCVFPVVLARRGSLHHSFRWRGHIVPAEVPPRATQSKSILACGCCAGRASGGSGRSLILVQ